MVTTIGILTIGMGSSRLASKVSINLLLLLALSLSSAHADSQAASSATRSRHATLLQLDRHRHQVHPQRRRFNAERLSFLIRSSLDTSSEYVPNSEVLERLRGGAFLGGDKNSARDDTTSLSKTPNQEVATDGTTSQSKAAKVGLVTIALFAIPLLIFDRETIKSSLSTFFDKEKFRKSIIQTLNNIASKGNTGLLLYTFGFIFWEVCGLPTSVVETAAGMAFGFHKGLVGSFVGKTCGSILAFTLGRTILSNIVGKKMEDMEPFGLIERGVARNPMQSTLIIRYSPFPQLVKNFSLSLIKPVTFPMFILAIIIHGFPFSLLWAALGYDSSLRLRASEAGDSMDANIILNGLLVFVTIFGFVVSPLVTGWWLTDLRKEN